MLIYFCHISGFCFLLILIFFIQNYVAVFEIAVFVSFLLFVFLFYNKYNLLLGFQMSLYSSGLPHGQEKSGNQEKSGKTKKNDKSQEKSGKNGGFL